MVVRIGKNFTYHKDKYLVRQIFQNRSNGQLLICVPRSAGFMPGDYVQIVPLELVNKNNIKTKKKPKDQISA